MSKRRNKRTYSQEVVNDVVRETVIRVTLTGGQVLAEQYGFTPEQRRVWVDMTLFHANPLNAGKDYVPMEGIKVE